MPLGRSEGVQGVPDPDSNDDLSVDKKGDLEGRDVKPGESALSVDVPGEEASSATSLAAGRVSEGEVSPMSKVRELTPEQFEEALKNKEDFGDQRVIVSGDVELFSDIDPSLLKNLEVKGSLLSWGSVTALPNKLHVKGSLLLMDCRSFRALPDNLQVDCDLKIYLYTSLRNLPDNLQVGGNLELGECTSLETLPDNLQVGGNLDLSDCGRLTTLPDNLQVGGHLILGYCTTLTALPDNLQLGRSLDLTGCTSLTSLPNWITTLGPTIEGETCSVHLIGTGLSESVLERLREAEAPGMQFLFSMPAEELEVPIADTVDEGLDFWMKLLPEGSAKPNLQVEPDQVRTVCTYLARLTNTAEYKNESTRQLLAQRVVNLFQVLSQDEGLKDVVLNVIEGGLESCDDRVINSFDEVDLAVKIYQADQRGDEVELRELAKGILMLEHVRAKANEHIATLTWVDEIEVMLAYQIGLQEKLNLPIETQNMIFRRCAHVSDEKLEAVGDEIVKEVTDEKVEAFLKDWDPWKKHLRREAVQSYEDIPQTDDTPESWECPISAVDFGPDGDAEDELPVLYEKVVYNFEHFKKQYIDSGTNPFNRQPIQWEKLRRIERG